MKKKVIISIAIISLLVGSFFFLKKSGSKNSVDPLETVLSQAAAYHQQGEHDLALELLNQLISQGEKDPRLLKMWQEILVENGESQTEKKTLEKMQKKLIERAKEALASKDYLTARSFANSAANLTDNIKTDEESQNIWWELAQQQLEEASKAEQAGQLETAQEKLMSLLEDKKLLNSLSEQQQKQIKEEINRQLKNLDFAKKSRESDSQKQEQLSKQKDNLEGKVNDSLKKDGSASNLTEESKEELSVQEESVNELYTQGITLYKQEKYKQALETFNRLLTKDDQPPRLHYARALSLRQLKQDDAAQNAFEEQIKREPQHSPSLWQLGELLTKKNQAQAEQLFKQALKFKDNDPRYLRSLAALYFNQEKYQLAKLYYQQSLKLSDAAEDYFNLGVTHLRENNYHAATVALEQALKKEPEATVEMQLALAQALYLSGNLQKAEKKLSNLLTARKDEKAAALLGKVYLEQKKYQQAAESLQFALAQSPKNSNYLNDLALVLIEQKNYKEALSLLNRALAEQPTSALLHYNLAKLYLKLEKFERSLEELKTSLALNAQQAEAHTALVNLYLQLKQVTDAEKAYKEFKRLLPDARELGDLAQQLNNSK